MIQVLSRNHYLGELKISLEKDKSQDTFEIHEMREAQRDKLNPNPFIKFIVDHKTEMQRLQKLEQGTIIYPLKQTHNLLL